MYKSQADSVKEWLIAYRSSEGRINEKLEKLRELRERMTSVGAQQMTDMPRAPQNTRDKMAEYVIRADELEREISEMIAVHSECKLAIEAAVGKLESETKKKIIRYRYIDGKDWSDIVETLYKDKKDWSVKINSYTRRVYRYHDKALEDLSRNWGK